MLDFVVIVAVVLIVVIVAAVLWTRSARRSSTRACEDIAAPRELVWNVITDYASQPKWRPEVDEVRITDEHTRTEVHHEDITVEIREHHRDQPSALEWTYIVHEPLQERTVLAGSWHIDLRDKPGGITEVCIRQRERDTRKLTTLIKSLRGRRTDLQVYLQCLRARCESPDSSDQ